MIRSTERRDANRLQIGVRLRSSKDVQRVVTSSVEVNKLRKIVRQQKRRAMVKHAIYITTKNCLMVRTKRGKRRVKTIL